MSGVAAVKVPRASGSSATIEAESVGSVALERLSKDGAIGQVHSVFEKAVNIHTSKGLVSVVCKEAGRGPINVVVDTRGDGFRNLGILVGDRVSKHHRSIQLGTNKVAISLRTATVHPPPCHKRARTQEDELIAANLELVRATTVASGRLGGIGELVRYSDGISIRQPENETNPFARLAMPMIRGLVAAIARKNLARVRALTGELVGLGPGLTPSADDVLVGMMLAMSLLAPEAGYLSSVCRAVAAEAKGRTTSLSQECIEQASFGRGNDIIMRLCEAIVAGGSGGVKRATLAVLEIGETSGTDTILGVILGTELGMRLGRS